MFDDDLDITLSRLNESISNNIKDSGNPFINISNIIKLVDKETLELGEPLQLDDSSIDLIDEFLYVCQYKLTSELIADSLYSIYRIIDNQCKIFLDNPIPPREFHTKYEEFLSSTMEQFDLGKVVNCITSNSTLFITFSQDYTISINPFSNEMDEMTEVVNLY
jgi:hypothetical protein